MSGSIELPRTKRRAIALVGCVWGEAFSSFFCRYSLATLLTDGNLRGIAGDFDVTLLLYTTAEDFAAIERDARFLAFKRYAAVEYVCIESFSAESFRNHWTYWQHAVAAFNERYFAFVLLIPDCIYASDSLMRIAAALEGHEIVYYCVPQICRELVVAELEKMKREEGDGGLSIPRPRLLKLLIEYINPKHAVAVHHLDFFATHPEYLLHVEPRRLGIIELGSHPLALRSASGSITRAFNPASARHDVAYLEVLGLGCESTLKYIEQYYRWPALAAHPSRHVSLASWCYTFREHGIPTYAGTQAEIAVHGASDISDRRSPVRGRRVGYANLAMQFIGAQYKVFEFARTTSSQEVHRCIALAMCLPGMRHRIAALGREVTIFLPSPGNIQGVLKAIQAASHPSAFREFCLMHVVAGHLQLKRGEVFRLRPSRGGGTILPPQVQLIGSHVPDPQLATATGKVLSYPYLIDEGVVIYNAELDYGNTTSMLRRLSRLPDSESTQTAVERLR